MKGNAFMSAHAERIAVPAAMRVWILFPNKKYTHENQKMKIAAACRLVFPMYQNGLGCPPKPVNSAADDEIKDDGIVKPKRTKSETAAMKKSECLSLLFWTSGERIVSKRRLARRAKNGAAKTRSRKKSAASLNTVFVL